MNKTTKDNNEFYHQIKEASTFIKKHFPEGWSPDIAVVLGSGLGGLVKIIENPTAVRYGDIPHMPTTSVSGHDGVLYFGLIGDKRVVCFSGRVHAYEGIPLSEITFNARLAHSFGCSLFIATNASGGGIDNMTPGDIMIIKDHINTFKRAPLAETSKDQRFGPENADFSHIYSNRLNSYAKQVAEQLQRNIYEGIYCSTSGPVYETPLEVRGFRIFGGSAFGMSTVPETMTAASLGMEVFAVALCTNPAAGLSLKELTHQDVKLEAEAAGPRFVHFMENFISAIPLEKRELYQLPQNADNSNDFNAIRPRLQKLITEEENNATVEYIKKKIPNFSASISILIPTLLEQIFARHLSDSVVIPLADLPFAPQLYDQHGKLIYGKTSTGKNILLISEGGISGITCEQSTFFTYLLTSLSVPQFYSILFAGSINEEEFGTVYGVTDCFDWTTVHPTVSFKQFDLQTSLFTLNNIYDEISGVKKGSYVGFLGPSYPTPVEVDCVSKVGADLVGITSLGGVYAMRSGGVDVASFAVVVHNKLNFNLSPDYLSHFQSFSDKLFSFIDGNSNNPLTREGKVVYKKISGDERNKENGYQLSYELSTPIFQGNSEYISSIVTEIRSAFNEPIHNAAILYDPFTPLLLQTLKAEKIALETTKEFDFYRAKLQDKNILLFDSNRFVNEGYNYATLTVGSRVIGLLDIPSVVIISPFCAVNENVKVGDLVIVSDQFNFTGRSPLFGHNDETWGDRFYDMAKVFTVKPNPPHGAKEANVGMVVGTAYNSPLEAKFYSTSLVDAVTTGLIFDTHVLRHCFTRSSTFRSISAFGVVTDSMLSSSPSLPIDGDLSTKLVDLFLFLSL